MVKCFILLTLFIFSYAASAQSLELPAASVNCDDSLKRCTYVVQNGTAASLIQKIERILFPGTILTPNEGYIEAESLKVISFWLSSEDLLERFKGLLPALDTFESFNPSSLVQVSIDVYGITETGLTNLTASLQSIGPVGEDHSGDFSLTSGNGAMDMVLRLGSSLLASALGSRSVKKYTKKLTTVTRFVPNLADISFAHTSNIYISPTAGMVEEETVGLNIGGKVSIERERSELIKVENFSFRYGVLIPAEEASNNRVNVLSVSNPEVYLLSGISNLIVSTTTDEVSRSRGWGLLSIDRDRDESMSKLMVVMRAEAVAFTDLIERMRDMRTRDFNGHFTAQDRANMSRAGLSVNQIIDTGIQPWARFTASGDRVMGFALDKEMASLANIDTNIEVHVKVRGMKQKAIRSVENLMISGLRFEDLPQSLLDRDLVKIKLHFKHFRGKTIARKVLWYNPQTNVFIEE